MKYQRPWWLRTIFPESTTPCGLSVWRPVPFDRHGGHVGYGGGYYDRTLPLLAPRFTLGCAFAAQEVQQVPVGPRDIRLDAGATERGAVRCVAA
jgi:5-formyltetrahydrofolate cyclo-ligase